MNMSDFELTFSFGPDYEENDCWVDEFGVVYSKDKKILKSYRDCELTEYHIPEGTETIGAEAFIFSRIKNVYLPESLLSIEDKAFEECFALEYIKIPTNVSVIEPYTFYGCKNLRNVEFNDNITIIARWAFANCSLLNNVILPKELKQIGDSAFFNCESLFDMKSFARITKIGRLAFGKTKISVDDIRCLSTDTQQKIFSKNADIPNVDVNNIPSTKASELEIKNGIKDEFGAIYSKDGKKLLKFTQSYCDDYFIKDGTEIICDEAFRTYGKNMISFVALPDSVMYIGNYAFWDCELTDISLSNNLLYIGEGAFTNCSFLKHIVLPPNLQIIGNFAFSGCSDMQDLNIPESIQSIGEGAIRYGIVTSQSPNYVVQDGLLIDKDNVAIHYFGNDTDYSTPSFISGVGYGCFYKTNIKKLTITGNVKFVGSSAIRDNKALETIIFEEGVSKIDDYVLCGCDNLTDVTIPDSITEIPENFMLSCYSVESIKLPQSIITLRSGSFRWCESLESIVIPDSVKSIETYVLSECKSLKFIELSSNLKHIENGSLEGADRLEYIIMTDEQEQFFKEYIIVKNKKILKRFGSFINPGKNLYRKKKDKDW